ncbi:hypothetical protein [Actinopolyspora mortivallis]|uniref:Uncharacterized protein n=1 Tax=Actinopolyspora mortivallis TaxID=33906 RepID=A0A2T0GT33_ACTMO|nr:hypothetical protein [Actinopolyspora mortivallis]PRW62259.1 hypothetical protein CEP50_16445 [Actinopolyspora mortivallis]
MWNYSNAPRCTVCAHRAIVTKHQAQRLVNSSGGRLVAYQCPIELSSWHVWAPEFERGGGSASR